MTLSSQTPSLHVSLFDGAARGTAPNALSEFRVRQLLPQLQAIHDKITGIAGRFVSFGRFAGPVRAQRNPWIASMRDG